MARICIRGIPDDRLPAEIDDFEMDSQDSLLSSAREIKKLKRRLHSHQEIVLAIGQYFLRGEDLIDRRERIQILIERFKAVGAKGSVVLLPDSLLKRPALDRTLDLLEEEFARENLPPPRIDTSTTRKLALQRIGDPMWIKSKKECETIEWRIHGHHPVRWVRRYSEMELRSLARKTLRYQPERITFAHSQRLPQAIEFAAIIKALRE